MSVNVLQMLTYLFDNYGDIEPGNLTENYKRLTLTYDISAPIETLWEEIEEAITYAARRWVESSRSVAIRKVASQTHGTICCRHGDHRDGVSFR